MPDRIYLDWNATTPPATEVIEAMADAQRLSWGNPASVHAAGRMARAAIEDVRERVASWCSCHPRDVVFTSGGTEANNMAVGAATALALSRLEHPSVIRAAEARARAGIEVRWLSVPESGRLDPETVAAEIVGLPAGACLIAMAANHETGVLQPVAELGELCRKRQLRLHCDAVQALGKVSVPFEAAHSVTLCGHKIRGPKGVGVLIWKGSPASLPALLRGGEQERGLRPGTVDVPAVVGFGKALERLPKVAETWAGLAKLRDALEHELAPPAAVNGAGVPRLPHVSNLSFPGFSGDELVAALDLDGIAVSSGSACSAGTQEPSPVIEAMVGSERARRALRVSLGEMTLRADVDRLIASLTRLLGRQTSSS